LTSNKVWIATDRSRARRCVEACVYGTLDFVGYPRFPAPVEFIAAVIAYYVHPVNIQTACLIMVDNHEYPFLYQRQTCHQVQPNQATYQKRQKCQPATYLQEVLYQL